jgi:hypothetical protein
MPAAVPFFARAAVDGVNGKIEAFAAGSDYRVIGPRRDGSAGLGLAGSLSVPLGQSFGLQLDGLATSMNGNFVGGGAHLFWRNPQTALVGVYGAYLKRNVDNIARARIGLEGEYYMGRFTIGGVAGFERTISDAFLFVVPGLGFVVDQGSKNRGFAAIDFSWYATENFKLSAGYRYWGGVSAAAAGFEYLVQTGQGAAYSFFAEGRAGENRYLAGMAGVKVYFGQRDKSLMRRHREDDPPNYLRDDLLAPRGTSTSPAVIIPPPPPPTCPPLCLES